MRTLLCVITLCLLTGCSHNTSILEFGTTASLGIDPQNMSAVVKYNDGMNLTDISRENTEWVIEVDSESGIVYDKTTGTVRGVRRIERKLGPQITGYLIDLAETDPETARIYMEAVKYYWQSEAAKAGPETKIK